MSKKITLLIASSNGSYARKFTFSRRFLIVFALLMLTGFLCAAFFSHEYFSLKNKRIIAEALEDKVKRQKAEITGQRKQIQSFASEINDLKSKIIDLKEFEKKIRIIANIENDDDNSLLFGVGGAIPENLDSNFLLSKNHSSLMREMHQHIGHINTHTETQKNSFKSLFTHLNRKKDVLARTPAINPTTGWVTSRFGYRKSPFTGLREFHKGIDISSRIGTPVMATADGTVAYCGKKGAMGITIIIDHGHGISTRYGHLSKTIKRTGDSIKRGDTIAQVGETGRSTGPHLHYDVLINGIPVNPEKYILN